MYETIFSLSKRPFLAAPRADRYFAAAPVENARQTLTRGIQRAEGPGLLIGPAGSGKSLICQLLAEQFADQFSVVQLSSTRLCTPRALLQNILFELGLPFRDLEEGELRLSLIDFLQRGEECPHGMLLLVDEANTLPLRLLEEIRMITNVVRDGVPRVRLVLAGGPQLEERFASPRLESLNQRISARCYLQSMTREETSQYVRHQIGLAGGDAQNLFSEDALRAVFNATDGIPRLVNQVCDHALMLAASTDQRSLTPAVIEDAWAELQQLPAPSLVVDQRADASDQAGDVIEFGSLDEDLDSMGDPEISLSDDELLSLAPNDEGLDSNDQSPHSKDNGPDTNVDATDSEDDSEIASCQSPADPFGHEFEEEEVVLDRYASLDSTLSEKLSASVQRGELRQLPQTVPDVAEQPTGEATDAWPAEEPSEAPPSAALGGSEPTADTAATVDFHRPGAEPSSDEALKQHAEVAEDPAKLVEDELSSDVEPEYHDAANFNESSESEPAIHSIEDAPTVACALPEDDRDMIIIEEETVHEASVKEPATARVHRREYRHLFAKLRQS